MKTTKSENVKYSRRAILKSLGIGAGFLPLLSTERSKAVAQTTGYPLRFIGITLTAGVCPPNFFPTGAAGPLPATLPSTLQPLAAWASKMILLRSASKQQSPIDLKVMVDIGSGYGGHWSLSRAADRRRHRKRDVGGGQRAVDRPAVCEPPGDTEREQRAAERRRAAVQELHELPLGRTRPTRR